VRKNLFVGNLPDIKDLELEQLLSRFGAVRFAAVITGKGVERGGRFGVVEMQSDAAARAAIRALDGFEVRGGSLTVRWASAAEQTACGHPAMFGSMNVSDVDGRDPPAA
jgi:RNA recognition motif-containing protein